MRKIANTAFALCGLLTPSAHGEPPPEPPAAVLLDGVVVRGQRERKPTVANVLGKSMHPVDRPLNHDLNAASARMQSMAEWSNDSDQSHHRLPETGTAGDPPHGCGADLTQGCASTR